MKPMVPGPSNSMAAAWQNHPDPGVFEDRLLQLPVKLIEVLEWMVRGHTTKDIAGTTGKAYKTIEVQRHGILKRMGFDNVVGLTAAYWCWKVERRSPAPVVIAWNFGNNCYYYQGYYHRPHVDSRQQRPADTTDIEQAAVFVSAAIARRIAREMNELQGAPHWVVLPKPTKSHE